jgi:hypothetical protein
LKALSETTSNNMNVIAFIMVLQFDF